MSLAMRAVGWYLRLAKKPTWSSAERMMKYAHGPKKDAGPPAALRARHLLRERTVAGFRSVTVLPRAGQPARTVLYLHGGGYVGEISPEHWLLVSRLADAGVAVEVPLYGLAPQHSFEEAYAFVTQVYRELLQDRDARTVTFIGDSAGGGLALGFAQCLAALGLPAPAALVLVAPWLDITCKNPEIEALEPHDPWLGRAGAIVAGRLWARGADPDDPRLSPINGELRGLPPIEIYVGTRDIVYPDVRKLQQRVVQAGAAGPRLEVTVCADACHVYPLVPVREGRAAAARIVQRVAAP